MGIFDKLFRAPKGSPLATPMAAPGKDDFASLVKEHVAHGGKRLTREYWNSIYLGAYAPQLDMAVLKGTKLRTSDGKRLVEALHDLLGEDTLGNTDWIEDDSGDLEGLSLSRIWSIHPQGIEVSLEVDNFHPTDDPLMLSIRPWKAFRDFVSSKG